jgi:hypothetical protein
MTSDLFVTFVEQALGAAGVRKVIPPVTIVGVDFRGVRAVGADASGAEGGA